KFLDRIKNAGGGFTMNRGHMGDGRVRLEAGFQRPSVKGDILAGAHNRMVNPGVSKHLGHSLAISAIDEHGDFSLRRHASLENSLDPKCAAPLKEHRFPAAFLRNP